MPRFTVQIRVMPRPTLLDPQGQAVEHALTNLGYEGVAEVRVGKALVFEVQRPDADDAQRDAESMCQRLLANPVTEDFTIRVTEAA